MTEQWLDLGRGTGKRPDAVLDDDVVRWLWHEQWSHASAKHCHFQPAFKYQLLVRTPAEPDVLREALVAHDWEVLAVGYQALSGKAYHMSDCATCCAPAYKPSPCDCAAPVKQSPLRYALERIADYENDILNGHEKFEAVQNIACKALAATEPTKEVM